MPDPTITEGALQPSRAYTANEIEQAAQRLIESANDLAKRTGFSQAEALDLMRWVSDAWASEDDE